MRLSTAAWLQCPQPKCASSLEVSGTASGKAPADSTQSADGEITWGSLRCARGHEYPILNGVAVVVPHVGQYLLDHVKGIAQFVPDAKIPAPYRREFTAARRELETGQTHHIDDDLEAERVNALYLATHYLGTDSPWWRPTAPQGVGGGSPLMDALIREHWSNGPFARLRDLVQGGALIELGCGVGGLLPALTSSKLTHYLGVDSSFASISHARALALGLGPRTFKIPADLLAGGVSQTVTLPIPPVSRVQADFIVGDLESPPLKPGQWGACVALNAIDMMNEPRELPRLQRALLKPGGLAYQSGPYIWHERIAKKLRKLLPRELSADSARAVEWLYAQEGFEVLRSVDHIPWLFFKHFRQLEIYSVHLFEARKLEPRKIER